MKLKLLSILMAVAVALAFTSCDSKKSRSYNDDSDSDKSKSEQIDEVDKEEAEEAIHPTGDIEKDAEALIQRSISIYKQINSAEDFKNIQKGYADMQKEFQEFYKNKGKGQDFIKVYTNMMRDPKYAKDLKESEEKIQKLINEAIDANNK